MNLLGSIMLFRSLSFIMTLGFAHSLVRYVPEPTFSENNKGLNFLQDSVHSNF